MSTDDAERAGGDLDLDHLRGKNAVADCDEEDLVAPDGDAPGEFICPLSEGGCGLRCTRGPSGIEYGHARHLRDSYHYDGERCSRRPAAEQVDPQRYSQDIRTAVADAELHDGRDERGRFV
jgi:hypothetical protein